MTIDPRVVSTILNVVAVPPWDCFWQTDYRKSYEAGPFTWHWTTACWVDS